MTVDQAREWLRIDGTENDAIIESLLAGATEYIQLATGLTSDDQKNSTLCNTITKYLLSLWYDPVQTDTEHLQRTIDSLLKLVTTLN